MKRTLVLGIIVLGGVMTAVVLTAQQAAPPAGGQGRGGGGFNFPPVGAIEKVAGNVYMVPGQGGNTAVYVAANGVVLVDTKLANNGQAILDQVKTVTSKPITHIINTHTHGDHTGSNQFFPASVEIVAHENTSANMQKMPVFQDAANKHGLTDRTFKDKMSLLSGKDTIDLYYFGAAHTNGDAFVVFKDAKVMHSGDAFANKAQPLLDGNNGGSGVAYPDTLAKAAKTIKNVTTVIPGHSAVTTWQDFVDFGEFNKIFLEHARASLKAGKTPEQAMMDFKLPEKFKGYTITGGRGGPAGNFGPIFQELQKK
jgi:glyoxylase-like metal-dependent hydrolase (beta-lactamase superfamily II)